MVAELALNRSVESWLSSIDEIDLSMIRMKLMDAEEGKGWSAGYCASVEVEYRRYLALAAAYPDKAIVPSKIVDQFWHFHILDTQAYADDCEKVFGTFLHHFPYFGMRGAEDAEALSHAYDETLGLYEAHFGPPDPSLWVQDGASRCPNCGRRYRP